MRALSTRKKRRRFLTRPVRALTPRGRSGSPISNCSAKGARVPGTLTAERSGLTPSTAKRFRSTAFMNVFETEPDAVFKVV